MTLSSRTSASRGSGLTLLVTQLLTVEGSRRFLSKIETLYLIFYGVTFLGHRVPGTKWNLKSVGERGE